MKTKFAGRRSNLQRQSQTGRVRLGSDGQRAGSKVATSATARLVLHGAAEPTHNPPVHPST